MAKQNSKPEPDDKELPDDDGDSILDAEGEEQEDGSVDFALKGDEDEKNSEEFMENLAETIDEGELRKIASNLLDFIEIDKESRKKRDEKYKEGLRRTGLGDDAPGGASFEGSSRVVHPILAESCIDFESRAIKELFPASGPAKMNVVGRMSEEKLDRAERKVKYLNWQLTKQMSEYRPTLEQVLMQVPMGGSQYEKFWYDPKLKRPRTTFVPVDDILLPYSVSDFYSSHRMTHVQHLTTDEINDRVDSGIYADVLNSYTAPVGLDKSAASEANDKIEGKEDAGMNEDGQRDVYEIYTFLELKGDKKTKAKMAPYIVTIDEDSEKVLAVYRNWQEDDENFRKLDWIVEYQFIPWRGAYGIGLPHLIGGLSGAATGALRALLDSAHIANSASLVKLKSGKSSGKSLTVEPTEIAEIDAPAGTDDIRKVVMSMPFNPPSNVLFDLLNWLTTAGKSVVATAEESMTNIGDRTPVGTTMAMIEQGSATYSAIHARLHYSQAKALQVLCRINAQFLDDEVIVKELDELVVSRADFANSDDIIPVSDPNIFSESQRFAQVQGVAQIRQMFPAQAFDENYIARMMLKRMRVEDVDSILPATKKPQNMNPVAENVAALQGTPLLAMPNQNHMAHIMAHLEFCGSPIYGSQIMGQKLLPIMVEHIKQHLAFHYSTEMEKLTHFSDRAADTPTQEMEQQIFQAQDGLMAKLNQELGQVMQALGAAAQKAQQYNPPAPTDPAVQAQMQVAMAEVDRKKQNDQALLSLKQKDQADTQAFEQQKHETQLTENDANNKQHQQTELMKNHEDNLTNQWIAALNANQDTMLQREQAQLDQFTNVIQQTISGNQDKMDSILQFMQSHGQMQNDNQQQQVQLQHDAEQNDADREHQAELQSAAQAAQPTQE